MIFKKGQKVLVEGKEFTCFADDNGLASFGIELQPIDEDGEVEYDDIFSVPNNENLSDSFKYELV